MKPLVLYLRVSTQEQSVLSQHEALLSWAKVNNFNVVQTFGEKVSGYDLTAQRTEYDSMKKYVLKNNIKDICVWEISRLSRSMVQTVNEIDYFSKQGVNIHFLKENLSSLSDNVTNQLMLTILSSMAQMERDTFIERGNRGRLTAARKGRMIGYSNPPYGYTSDEDGLLCVEPNEAKIVSLMYELSLKGNTLYNIAQELNSLGVPTRATISGKKKEFKGKEIDFLWNPNTVRRILGRTLNKGIRIYKGETISVPAIVSEFTWDAVNENFKTKLGYINRTKYNYLFKGIMKCGVCNRHIVTHKAPDTEYGYYLCTAVVNKYEKCTNGKHMNSRMIDDNLYPALFDQKYIEVLMKKDFQEGQDRTQKEGQIAYYKRELLEIEGKQKRLKTLYTKNYIELPEFEKEFSALKSQDMDFRNKIKLLEDDLNKISNVDIVSILKNYKGATDYTIKRNFVTKHVNTIKIFKVDVANVDWQKPLHKNEKIIYAEIYIFNYRIPIKVLLTPYTKNVIVSETLHYIPETSMIVDLNFRKNLTTQNIL